jgi:hypothetical protein
MQTIKYIAVINKVTVIVHAVYSGTYGEIEAIYTPHDKITNIKSLLSKATAKIAHDKLQIRISDLNASDNLLQYINDHLQQEGLK